MKRALLIFSTFLMTVSHIVVGQEYSDPNVMSYYAMGNSLDGQPMIETANVLRFYPVFALREWTTSVIVTVYNGSSFYTDTARPMDEKRYWEARLPQFQLGEAIQRIDVQTAINLSKHPLYELHQEVMKMLQEILLKIPEDRQSLDSSIRDITGQRNIDLLDMAAEQIRAAHTDLRNRIGAQIRLDMGAEKLRMYDPDYLHILLCELRKLCAKLSDETICIDPTIRGDLRTTISEVRDYISRGDKRPPISVDTVRINAETQTVITNLSSQLATLPQVLVNSLQAKVQQTFDSTAARQTAEIQALLHLRDSLRDIIASESYERFYDTSFSGPSVRKGDVIIGYEPGDTLVKILYRNHKTSLRQLPALDPVESMGIFRLRYIPFVIIGDKYTATFNGDQGAVFEIGLAFGDVRFAGDDFVKPALSIRRLGVAFAITNKLFSDEASVRALALTYDFNAYGSIGVGANFQGKDPAESYVSLGINKKAFESLLKGIDNLFR